MAAPRRSLSLGRGFSERTWSSIREGLPNSSVILARHKSKLSPAGLWRVARRWAREDPRLMREVSEEPTVISLVKFR